MEREDLLRIALLSLGAGCGRLSGNDPSAAMQEAWDWLWELCVESIATPGLNSVAFPRCVLFIRWSPGRQGFFLMLVRYFSLQAPPSHHSCDFSQMCKSMRV